MTRFMLILPGPAIAALAQCGRVYIPLRPRELIGAQRYGREGERVAGGRAW